MKPVMRVSVLVTDQPLRMIARLDLFVTGNHSCGGALRLSQGGEYRVHLAS